MSLTKPRAEICLTLVFVQISAACIIAPWTLIGTLSFYWF